MGNQTEPVTVHDRFGPELPLGLERTSGRPLHEQLETALREYVRAGRLPPSAKLPSSRALAQSLGISRGVVLEAYSQLIAEGYLVSSRGAPTRVAAMPSIERPPVPASSLEPACRHRFDPGLPDLAAFPREQWGRSLRVALREAPFAAFDEGDPRGATALRNELMGYLGRTRGAAPEPEHTIVCAGATQGFMQLCRVLHERGVERIAVERPGWNRHRAVAEGAGLEPVGIGVDEHGIVVDELAASGCEAVVVTPAHQFPTGAVMSSERRTVLLEWAEDEDALIVEDDYDSELRYDRVPVGALQGLAPERVLQLGSLSKRLAPGVKIGWMLSPSWLSGALTYEQGLAGAAPGALEQLALADFLARESSTGTFGECGCGIASAAAPWSTSSRAGFRARVRSGSRPACTCSCCCRRERTSTRCCAQQRVVASRSKGSRPTAAATTTPASCSATPRGRCPRSRPGSRR